MLPLPAFRALRCYRGVPPCTTASMDMGGVVTCMEFTRERDTFVEGCLVSARVGHTWGC